MTPHVRASWAPGGHTAMQQGQSPAETRCSEAGVPPAHRTDVCSLPECALRTPSGGGER